MRDAQGLDPDEDYTAVDNPFWDGTDAAHPAWWRGYDYGVIRGMKILQDIRLKQTLLRANEKPETLPDPELCSACGRVLDEHGLCPDQ